MYSFQRNRLIVNFVQLKNLICIVSAVKMTCYLGLRKIQEQYILSARSFFDEEFNSDAEYSGIP